MRNTILLILALALVTSCGEVPTKEKLVEGPMGIHVGDSVTVQIPLDSTNTSWRHFKGAVVKAVGNDWVEFSQRRFHEDRLKEAHDLMVTCPHDK